MENYHLYFASCVRNGGIYHYTLQGGTLCSKSRTVCDRPMYLYAEKGRLLALLRQPFTDSQNSGLISFTLDEEGNPAKTGEIVSTRGEVACHLCRFQGKTYVANYLSGSLWRSDGILDVHQGKGVHQTRQEAPHVHYVTPSPDGTCLLAVDLGLDAIFSYDENLQVLDVAHVPAGHGSRHLAFSEDGQTVFCVNELASTVTVFDYKDGQLESGKTPCRGASPRDFLIVEDMLICTNEIENNVTFFRVEKEKLVDTKERIFMEAPLCVVVMGE